MKWILVFYMLGDPGGYRAHWAFQDQAACLQRADRYKTIYSSSGSTMTAECRPRQQVNLQNPNNIVIKSYRLY